jgi:predicted transcriptional regulator
MAHTTLNEVQIKELFKQAFVELLQEQKDLLYEVVEEIVEDLALVRAIKEGEETGIVGRGEVFRVLEEVS